jgi:uncharacterized membrane protein (DUF2068 family)
MGQHAIQDRIQERDGSSQSVAAEAQVHPHHHRGLLIIGIFKLLKSIFFFCIGLGALHLLHKDIGDEAMRLATALRFDPEGRFVSLMLAKVDLIDVHRLREIGFGTFTYSALALTEGVGLTLEKVWAEYLTLSLTVMFLPWELWELIRDPTMMRLALLAVNLAVLGYLLWLLKRKKRAAGLA